MRNPIRIVVAALAVLLATPAVASDKPVHRQDLVAAKPVHRPVEALKDAAVDPSTDTSVTPAPDPAPVAVDPSTIPAQDSLSGLCVRLSENWTLHPMASLSVVSYDLTHKNFVGELAVSGLYEARYKDLVGFAAGLGFQTGPVNGLTATGLVTLPYHMAVGAQYQWVGTDHAVSLLVAPTFRF